MSIERLSRRDFIRDGSVAAAGVAAGLSLAPIVRAGNPDKADTSKILNYNPDMEYRPCGKTGMMVSAVCMGGHWKRVDTVVGGMSKGNAWGNVDLANPEFQKNRTEVVSRAMDRGMNYIDACTGGEVMAYCNALKGRREKMHLGFSWAEGEVRNPECRTFAKLQETFLQGLKPGRPGVRRSVADHLPGAEQPARRADHGRAGQSPGLGQEEGSGSLHRHFRRTTGRTSRSSSKSIRNWRSSSRRSRPRPRSRPSRTGSACGPLWPSSGSAGSASSPLPATRCLKAPAPPTTPMPPKTTAWPGWPSVTSSAMPRLRPPFPD